jgi:hypothetical protein
MLLRGPNASFVGTAGPATAWPICRVVVRRRSPVPVRPATPPAGSYSLTDEKQPVVVDFLLVRTYGNGGDGGWIVTNVVMIVVRYGERNVAVVVAQYTTNEDNGTSD